MEEIKKNLTGFVNVWNEERAFGFIRTADKLRAFVHRTNLVGEKQLSKGAVVTFDIIPNRPGTKYAYQAVNVVVVG